MTKSKALLLPVRRAGLLILCASLVACTSVRPVALDQGGKASPFGRLDDLQPGDRITLLTTQGDRITMNVAALDASSIEGKVEGRPSNLRLQNENIVEVQREETSVLKTSGLVVAIAYLVGGLVVSFVLF